MSNKTTIENIFFQVYPLRDKTTFRRQQEIRCYSKEERIFSGNIYKADFQLNAQLKICLYKRLTYQLQGFASKVSKDDPKP